jgi:acyl carrier protein
MSKDELDHILLSMDQNDLWSRLGADSLDMVEVMMEVEEHLDKR